jgi:hypothetical protein
VNDVVELARSEIRPRIVEDLSNEELIQQISAADHDASHALQVVPVQVVPEEIPILAGAGSGGNSGISSARNASQRSMASHRPNEQSLYRSTQAFVRDQNQGGLLPRMLQFTVTHAGLVELACSEIRRRVVDSLSDEELIQQISAAVRDTSQVVPEAIPMVARAGSGGDASISSVSMHQAEGNHAVELESRSLGTFSSGTGAQPANDDVIGGGLDVTAEVIFTSSSKRQNRQANSSRGESHALSPHQPPQNEGKKRRNR